MKVLFAGTPSVAIPALEQILSSTHEVVGVITREDSITGRKKILTPSPVALYAQSQGIPVIKSNVVTTDVKENVEKLHADIGIVIAFGSLLPASFLETTQQGWFNVHFSILPQYRGAAPAQWAIRNGDHTTGSTLFKINEGLDTGDVYSVVNFSIGADETTGELLERMSIDCAQQVISLLDNCELHGEPTLFAQKGEVSFAPKLVSTDGRLNPSMSSAAVYNVFRSVTPDPGAFVMITGERLKIHSARHNPDFLGNAGRISEHNNAIYLSCSEGSLELHLVQPSGKKPMSAQDWWRGVHKDFIEVDL